MKMRSLLFFQQKTRYPFPSNRHTSRFSKKINVIFRATASRELSVSFIFSTRLQPELGRTKRERRTED
jgi:hypothetical protein